MEVDMRDGSSSICVHREYAPIHYHWYRSDPSRSLIQEVYELLAAAGLPTEARDRLVGELRARMFALVRGRLVPVDHVKGPMESVTGIDVFELRAGVEYGEADRAELRVYHVEPSQLKRLGGTSTVVGLHVHDKSLSGSSAAIILEQDRQLQIARGRYFEGRRSAWGGAELLPS